MMILLYILFSNLLLLILMNLIANILLENICLAKYTFPKPPSPSLSFNSKQLSKSLLLVLFVVVK